MTAAVRTASQLVSPAILDMHCVLCDVQHGVYLSYDMALTGSNTLDMGLISPKYTSCHSSHRTLTEDDCRHREHDGNLLEGHCNYFKLLAFRCPIVLKF